MPNGKNIGDEPRLRCGGGCGKILLWSFTQLDKGGCIWDSSSLWASFTEVIYSIGYGLIALSPKSLEIGQDSSCRVP